MCARIEKYRRTQPADLAKQYNVGCLMIQQPVFFLEQDWVPKPADFSKNIVRGAGYDVSEGEGRRIWEACLERVRAHRVPSRPRKRPSGLPSPTDLATARRRSSALGSARGRSAWR